MKNIIKAAAAGLLTVAALAPVTGVLAADQPAAPRASIPFVNFGAIRDWQADGDKGLWVEDMHQQWYYAELIGPCVGLDFAYAIGFDVRPLDTLDRFGAVIVPGYGRCNFASFSASNGPPPRHRTGKASDAAAAAQG